MADLARDPHLARSTYWLGDSGPRHRHPTRVPKFQGEPEPDHGKAPAAGRDTREVLREILGYGDPPGGVTSRLGS
jgi:crotonobetainyl-CoA:carnitine CoA-transferase CaiB-like acyl-CoA transferase